MKDNRYEAMRQAQHYRAESLRQNNLLKEADAKANDVAGRLEEMDRRFSVAEEARLNNQELYEIARDEASIAVKAQGALKRIIEHMETEQLPQKIKIMEMESMAKAKEEAYQELEKQYKSVKEDHQTINTLL